MMNHWLKPASKSPPARTTRRSFAARMTGNDQLDLEAHRLCVVIDGKFSTSFHRR